MRVATLLLKKYSHLIFYIKIKQILLVLLGDKLYLHTMNTLKFMFLQKKTWLVTLEDKLRI